jgi:acetyl-CoA carboxylase biotin carboxyl carrier protein
MDIRKIKKLIEMLQDSDLTEIEVKEGEESVRIVRGNAQQIEVKSIPTVKSSINISEEKDDEMSIDAGSKIKSPIVGTFYRKPAPDKPPFVEIGSHVNAGDVVCIVEAMKMMNEIKSDFSGKVISIDLEDGQPVEYGQSIITIN